SSGLDHRSRELFEPRNRDGPNLEPPSQQRPCASLTARWHEPDARTQPIGREPVRRTRPRTFEWTPRPLKLSLPLATLAHGQGTRTSFVQSALAESSRVQYGAKCRGAALTAPGVAYRALPHRRAGNG